MTTGRSAEDTPRGVDSGPPRPGPAPSSPSAEASAAARAPGLAVAAVARRLGVAPATLRTWDRRYGLGPSDHSAGAHRRYSDEDVARLMVMRRLALEGVSPADAARAALAVDLSGVTREKLEAELRISQAQADVEHGRGARPVRDAGPLVAEDRRPAAVPEPPSPHGGVVSARTGENAPESQTSDAGTRRPVLRLAAPVSSTEITSTDVIDAVLRGNLAACERLLASGIDDDPAQWWTTLVEPTLRKLAARTVLAKPGEAPETLLASATLKVLADFIRTLEERTARETGQSSPHPSQLKKIVLLFSAVDDTQPLAMHALAAALVAQGVTARIVTGPANAHRAMELVTMVRPVATVLVTSLTRPELGIVHALHEAQPELPIFVGLSSDDAAADLPLSSNVSRVRSFQGLLHEVIAVAR